MCARCYIRVPGNADHSGGIDAKKPYVRAFLSAGELTGRGSPGECSRSRDSRRAGMSELSLYALCPVFVHNPPALNRRWAPTTQGYRSG
jgi:hypothetical protein